MHAKRFLKRKTGTLCNLGQCFVAGTQVLTDQGLKNIEDIKVGDFVLSKDPTTGKTDYKPVVNTFIVQHAELYVLTYRDASGDAYELKVSGEHPFWVADKGWVAARQLAIDDKLVITDETVVSITNITLENAPKGETFTTHNFEVDDYHTYFVLQEGKTNGAFAVLVHNAFPCGPLHKNAHGYVGHQAVYEIRIDGKIYKYGKADMTNLSSNGNPLRLENQLKRLKKKYKNKKVTGDIVYEHNNISTLHIKQIETGFIQNYKDTIGKGRIIPRGNKGHPGLF